MSNSGKELTTERDIINHIIDIVKPNLLNLTKTTANTAITYNKKGKLVDEYLKEYIKPLVKSNADFYKKIVESQSKYKDIIEDKQDKQDVNLEQFLDKKYKSPLKIWELYSANAYFTLIGCYYVFVRYNNSL